MAENNPDDMYSDAEIPVSEPAEETEAEEGQSDAVADGEQTALLPTALFMGKELKPGTRCEIEIEHIHDGQVEVKYVPHKSSSTPKKESDMDSMLS